MHIKHIKFCHIVPPDDIISKQPHENQKDKSEVTTRTVKQTYPHRQNRDRMKNAAPEREQGSTRESAAEIYQRPTSDAGHQ